MKRKEEEDIRNQESKSIKAAFNSNDYKTTVEKKKKIKNERGSEENGDLNLYLIQKGYTKTIPPFTQHLAPKAPL